MTARVQQSPFDFAAEVADFQAAAAGAVVTFTGIVRDDTGTLQHMEIEHFPAMTEKSLTKFAEQAREKFQLENVMVIHRFGVLKPGEMIMMVATAARHRKDAFGAADYLMDYLKSRAPFWKKEVSASGATWVAAKDQDEQALRDWDATLPG